MDKRGGRYIRSESSSKAERHGLSNNKKNKEKNNDFLGKYHVRTSLGIVFKSFSITKLRVIRVDFSLALLCLLENLRSLSNSEEVKLSKLKNTGKNTR